MKNYINEKTHEIQKTNLEQYFNDIFKEIKKFNLKIDNERRINPEIFIEPDKKSKKTTKYDMTAISKLKKIAELQVYISNNITEMSLVKTSIIYC